MVRRFIQGVLVALAAMLIAACASAPTPPEVRDVSEAPIERETTPEATPPPSNAATRTLLAAADEATQNHNHTDAVAYLERAIRLDSRNSDLWVRLSSAHLAKGEIEVARQHARKAIALAGSHEALSRSAWLQLADVEEADGNTREARSLRRRYRPVRS